MLQAIVAGDGESSALAGVGKPGSAWSLLVATLRLYGRFPHLFFVLAVVVVVPYDLALLAITGAGPLETARLGFVVSQLLGLADLALISPLISALHVHAVREARDGGRPRLASVARDGMRVLPVVATVTVISWLGILAGCVLLFVPGVILLMRWSVAAQVAAIDNGGWKPALQSSRLLTVDRWSQVFPVIVFVGVVAIVPQIALSHLFPRDSTTLASVSCGVLWSVLSRSFSALVVALLFFDLRDRRPEATSANAPAITAQLEWTQTTGKAPPAGEPVAPYRAAARPVGNPIDPRSYSDAERPRGWWIDPSTPGRIRYWGAGDRQGWSGHSRTPRKLRQAWRTQDGGELPRGR